MYCVGTHVIELAALVKQQLDQVAAQHSTLDIYGVHIYLQGEETEAGGGHPHYGVYCDTSYGGTPEAVAAVQEGLPGALYHLRYDEAQYDDAYAAFDAAYAATFL